MNEKLTWKRKMSITTRNSFIITLIVLLCNAFPLKAQRDSLAPVLLTPVEITKVKPSGALPFAGTTIGREEIDQRLGNGSINNLMDLVPSVIITSDAGTGIGNTAMRIRGIDHTRINVTINGIELNDAESQGTWFVNLPNFGAYTQDFTLQRGVGTSTNGAAAFGASMNFTTQTRRDKPFFELTTAAGSFATFRNNLAAGTGLIKERFSASVAYSNVQSKGFIERASADLNSLFLTADYRLLNKKKEKDYGTLRFNVLFGKEKTGLAWNGVPSSMLEKNRTYNSCGEYVDAFGNTQYYENETDNYQQTHYQLFYILQKKAITENYTHQIDFTAGAHLTRGFGYYEQYKDDAKFSKYGLSNFKVKDTVIKKTDLVRRKYLDNYFYGFTFNVSDQVYKKESLNPFIRYSIGGGVNYYDGSHYGKLIWMQYAGNVPINYEWYRNRAHKGQTNIYGKVEYLGVKKLLLYADLQYRCVDYRMKGVFDNLIDTAIHYQWFNFINPKIGFNYAFDEAHRNSIYFSFAISHREPARSDIVEALNYNQPTSERVYDVELGYLLKRNRYAFNANAYFMYYQNQLVLTGTMNDVGKGIMFNVDKSFRTGIELVSTYRPVHYFCWSINGTFSLNKILDYTHYIDDWDTGEKHAEKLGTTDISFSPNIVASNEFVFTPVRDFDIALITKIVSRQYLDNTSDEKHCLKAYSYTNLQLSYKLHTRPIPEIGFFFQVNNMLNFFQKKNMFNAQYETNGGIERFYASGEKSFNEWYFPQAGINVMGGIRIKF